MSQTNDNNVEQAKTQRAIQEHLGLPSDRLVFNFIEKEGIVVLELITINPVHEQSFLLQSFKGVDRIDALNKMKDYVEQKYEEEKTYTMQWSKLGDANLHTSYFRASGIQEVLNKFYYEREQTSYTIYSITLNPMT